MKINNISFKWRVVYCICVLGAIRNAWALPRYENGALNSPAILEVKDPKILLEMLTRFGQIILHDRENNKRGLDLGVGRGYSGKQAAKQLIGLAAAKSASGPGKRTEVDFSSSVGSDLNHLYPN